MIAPEIKKYCLQQWRLGQQTIAFGTLQVRYETQTNQNSEGFEQILKLNKNLIYFVPIPTIYLFTPRSGY